MKTSEKINEIASALSKAQGAMKTAVFDSKNPHFKSRYASLTAIMEVARGPLMENGLSIVHTIDKDKEELILTTTLLHTSGQFISGSIPLVLSKKDMQGIGSAITYAKRYCTSAILGIVSDEDDDGNAACNISGDKGSNMAYNIPSNKKISEARPLPIPKNQMTKTFEEVDKIKKEIFDLYTFIKVYEDDRIKAIDNIFSSELSEVKNFATTREIKKNTYAILNSLNNALGELAKVADYNEFMLKVNDMQYGGENEQINE